MTEIPPSEPGPGPAELQTNALGGAADAEIVLSQTDDEKLTLHVANELRADVLDLSLKVTPPGKYVQRSSGGSIGWSDKPYYFSFNKIEQSRQVSVFVLEEPRVASKIPFGARVEIASSDQFLAASIVWSVRPKGGVLFGSRFWIAALLCLFIALVVVSASRSPSISDFACARWSVCSAEQVALQAINSCSARASACESSACIGQFKSKFPSSRVLPVVTKIEQDGAERCRAADDDKYAAVSHCVQEKINTDSCNVRSCFADYDMTKRTDRVSQAQTIMAVAAERCRIQSSTPTVTNDNVSPVEPQPPRERPDSSAVSRPILADGPHQAVQHYTGSRSRADPANCPATANFVVDVRGGSFTYSRPDFFDGAAITRTWVGSIDQTTGQIAILGSKGNPSTKNAMTVVGAYNNATVLSDFCGSGDFRIEP